MLDAHSPDHAVATLPRSRGNLTLTARSVNGVSAIGRLRTSGATKIAFPRRAGALEAIVVNTSGGLTGGDRFVAEASAGPGSRLVLTTQAAERAYLSRGDLALVSTRLAVAEGATLHWLPQEMILFDGAALERRLVVDLSGEAEFLMVEPVIFGRAAMGETVRHGRFRDRVEINRGLRPLYRDGVDLAGDVEGRLRRGALAAGARAMASVVHVSRRAEGLLATIRRMLPPTAGASLLGPDVLALRLLAPDGFLLRRSLVPILTAMAGTDLPRSWSL
jgi:urease accessory protein